MQHPFEDESSNFEVSMTSLIDCVFLLLVFFLVSSMTIKKDRDSDLKLAKSNAAEERLPRDDNQVIGINAEGELFLNGEETTMMHLHRYLRPLALAKVEIRLDADARAPMHAVVEVLELCQFSQLEKISLRTHDEHYNKK